MVILVFAQFLVMNDRKDMKERLVTPRSGRADWHKERQTGKQLITYSQAWIFI